MHRKFLFAPGPTPVPEQARLAMARSQIHHRGPEFKQIFGEVREQLKWLFETVHEVLVLTCSGTGAFEAAIINFTRRNDKLIAIGGGKFSERWGKIARAYGLQVINLDLPWGEAVSVEVLSDALAEHPDCAMVTVCASETSTGVYHPVKELAEVVRNQSHALLAVDGITAVGVHRLPMDEWGIDILVSGSQKAFGIPPGLGFLAANERAWKAYESSDHPKFYFDLGRERASQLQNQTAFTPAASLVIGLREVLGMMMDEGLEALIRRHTENAEATRAGVKALGLELFAQSPSNAVTAARVPDGVVAKDVVRCMRECHGVTIAAGQDHLAGQVIRLGHIGFFDRADILMALSTLELALVQCGAEVEMGKSLVSAQRVYAQSLES